MISNSNDFLVNELTKMRKDTEIENVFFLIICLEISKMTVFKSNFVWIQKSLTKWFNMGFTDFNGNSEKIENPSPF
jgi:hypothetical protein